MLTYYIVFAISIACLVLAEKLEQKNKDIAVAIKILAIFIPALLAGMRAVDVGTDTKLYIEPAFNDAVNTTDFSAFYKMYDIEPLYMLFTFVCAKIFANVNVFMTALYFIITLLAYKIAKDNSDKAPLSITYAVFLLFYFNKSLNLVRQTMSILLIIYGLKYVKNKKYTKSIAIILVSILIHKTAIIGALIYLIYGIFDKKNTKYYKIIILVVSALFLIVYKPLLNFLINDIHVLNSRYNYYINSNKVDVSLSYMLFNLLLLIWSLTFYKKLVKHDKFNEYLVFIVILGNILMLLSTQFNFVIRISYYFTYLYLLIIPEMVEICDTNKKKLITAIAMLTIFGAYNYIYYGYQQNDKTCPYKSIFNNKNNSINKQGDDLLQENKVNENENEPLNDNDDNVNDELNNEDNNNLELEEVKNNGKIGEYNNTII